MPHTYTPTFTLSYMLYPLPIHPWPWAAGCDVHGHPWPYICMQLMNTILSSTGAVSPNKPCTLDWTGVMDAVIRQCSLQILPVYTYLYNYTHMYTVVLVFVHAQLYILYNYFQQYEYNTNNVVYKKYRVEWNLCLCVYIWSELKHCSVFLSVSRAAHHLVFFPGWSKAER